ncbi:MAG: glutamine amidotransferase [Hyphomicrobiaceae bacterium]|nr:glutamine amidotransferase [Hyphomicrobiaceae bacterium]
MVLHQRHSNPGHVGRWFRLNGYSIDIRRHFDGDPLPPTLSGHCGAIIFGGPQSANDALDYIRREVDWIGVALKEQKPFLGICLGAQMLAHHLGARVDHCTRGTVEIGYHAIRATQAGAHLSLPPVVYQWHREGFDMPRDGVLLATSDGAYPHQAFKYGAAYGVQFHPEITFEQVNRWSGSNSMRLLMRGARPRHEQIDHHLVHSITVHRWLDRFLTGWAAGELSRG